MTLQPGRGPATGTANSGTEGGTGRRGRVSTQTRGSGEAWERGSGDAGRAGPIPVRLRPGAGLGRVHLSLPQLAQLSGGDGQDRQRQRGLSELHSEALGGTSG